MPERIKTPHKEDMNAADRHVLPRPLWKRIIYPIVGAVLIILGIAGWLVPIVPGFPLIIVGLPLLFFFNQRFECCMRGYIRGIGHFIMKRMKKKRSE